jgi:hypothetical protein
MRSSLKRLNLTAPDPVRKKRCSGLNSTADLLPAAAILLWAVITWCCQSFRVWVSAGKNNFVVSLFLYFRSRFSKK